jgi:hypothetical protein
MRREPGEIEEETSMKRRDVHCPSTRKVLTLRKERKWGAADENHARVGWGIRNSLHWHGDSTTRSVAERVTWTIVRPFTLSYHSHPISLDFPSFEDCECSFLSPNRSSPRSRLRVPLSFLAQSEHFSSRWAMYVTSLHRCSFLDFSQLSLLFAI